MSDTTTPDTSTRVRGGGIEGILLKQFEDTFAPPSMDVLDICYIGEGNGNPATYHFTVVDYSDETMERKMSMAFFADELIDTLELLRKRSR